MQRRSAWLLPGHGSPVMPTSVLTSPPPPPPARWLWQAVSATARTRAHAATLRFPCAVIGHLHGMACLARLGSVGEGPGPPVVAGPDPEAEQPPRLGDQEDDDEDPVQDRLELEGGEEPAGGL